jgi:hypothetical protein
MTNRRGTLRDAILAATENLIKYDENDPESFSETEKTFIDKMTERDLEKQSNALVQIEDKIRKLESDLNKINRPDHTLYGADRKPMSESYTKGRLDEIEKLTRTINKLTNSMEKALKKGEWNDLYNLASGKESGGDSKGGGSEKGEGEAAV